MSDILRQDIQELQQEVAELKKVENLNNLITLKEGIEIATGASSNTFIKKAGNLVEINLLLKNVNGYFTSSHVVANIKEQLRGEEERNSIVGFGTEQSNGWSVVDIGLCRITKNGDIFVRYNNSTYTNLKYVFVHITYVL